MGDTNGLTAMLLPSGFMIGSLLKPGERRRATVIVDGKRYEVSGTVVYRTRKEAETARKQILAILPDAPELVVLDTRK